MVRQTGCLFKLVLGGFHYQAFLQPKVLESEAENDLHYACGDFNFDKLS